nr:hypothetical protein [Pedobacter sp. ASV19]
MRKLIFAVSVVLFTGAFEQKAAIKVSRTKPRVADQIINSLDSLRAKTDHLVPINPQIHKSHEK